MLSPRQKHALECLGLFDRPATPSMVAKKMGVSRENAHRLLDELTSKNEVERTSDAKSVFFKPGSKLINKVIRNRWNKGFL